MRILALVVAFFVISIVTGCSARTSVDVTARPDGGGVVEVTLVLDPEAAKRVGDLDDQFRSADLAAAGWEVDKAQDVEGGGRSLSVRRKFSSPEEGTAVLRQLTGDDGALKYAVLTQTREGTKVTSHFSATADVSAGLNSFGDEALVGRVGSRLGLNADEVLSNVGTDANSLFPVELRVHLPGDRANRTPAASEDGTWQLNYGESVALSASSTAADRGPLLFIALGLLLLALGMAIPLLWKADKYVPRHTAKHRRHRSG